MSAPKLAWIEAAARLSAGEAALVSLWADEGAVAMAISRPERPDIEILRLDCAEGAFPSVAALHPPADRLERALCDLYGFRAIGAPDPRPWLDHGVWPIQAPQGAATLREDVKPAYVFRTAEGPGLHQIPVGPIHAGIIEPGHFRFHASGETIVRLEARLGYVHKGVGALMRGSTRERAALLAGRISGDSTVAYALAFSTACEAALGVQAPPRALWLRALMAEWERIANHLGDIGAICNDASFALMLAHCGIWRERVLRACEAAFGHRLMMDAVAPGGVAVDLTPTAARAFGELASALRPAFARLVLLYDETASLQDRTVRTGVLTNKLASQYTAGGYVGRASGRSFDARRTYAYAPYERLNFEIATRSEGDVNARVWVRIREVEQSLGLVEQILAKLPSGPLRVAFPDKAGEGHAIVEGFRGDVFASVRFGEDGAVANAHLRDPSWFQWPLLEAAIEGNIVADFPICNKSFNCSYSGCDL